MDPNDPKKPSDQSDPLDMGERPAGGMDETASAPPRDDAAPKRGPGGPIALIALGLVALVVMVLLVARAAGLGG
jgi:hypothetical protein